MITIASFWPLDLLGRLHPLMVHFPIGLLVGVFLLEVWNRFRKKEKNYESLVYLGAFAAVVAAIMGGLLNASEDYAGDLIARHQFSGYLTAFLALITAACYWKKDRLLSWIPLFSLGFCCASLSVAGHLGASITHGTDYLSGVLPWNQQKSEIDPGLLQSFQTYAREDSFPQDQLDRLNLQVRAIFAHNCYQCHSTAKRKGDLALDHREGVFEGGESGPVFTVGKAEESELIRRLTIPRREEEAMPPKGKSLQKEEIELIKLWINQGAHWADESLKIFPEAEIALSKPDLPSASAGIDHPIDRFVDVYFKEQGLEWPKPVEDRQFVRRVHLDITGLLPSAEAVEAFLKNKSADKRAQLISDLLADKKNYSLHWLSFWNDLLRNDYSGTGFITGGRRQISDWLYKSLIEEKPYDQMVAELIDPTPESEGFIKGIQWRGEVNASQRTELQAAQNISQSLLGLNLKCASCHNSFINNITLDQAYGFANIFAEAPMEIYRCDKPTGRVAKTAFLYPELGEVVSDSLQNRLKELAGVIVQPENGRLYRTIVNRFWDRLFGRGIITPVDEMDNTPWSSDLLDWLAADFIDNGYRFQHLLTRIMTSKAYQLSAVDYPSSEYLSSNAFVFKGPALRRLSAEQFVDAFSQVIAPIYHGLAFDPGKREVAAEWIWHEEIEVDRRILPHPGTRLFRKTFSLKKGARLVSAQALITADHAFECFLNGKEIASGDDWREVRRADVPIDLLAGENIIAIRGKNEGVIPNPAGLLFSLRLQYENGDEQFLHSNRSWKTTADTLTKNWTALTYDDVDWEQAHRSGTFQNSYWGVLPDFSFEPDSLGRSFVRASLAKQDNFMRTLGRPTRENVATKRDEEATLLQALMLTNSEFFDEYISRGAQKWIDEMSDNPSQLIESLYVNALAREPTRKERKLLLRQLGEKPRPEQLEDVIWALVLLPEFQFI